MKMDFLEDCKVVILDMDGTLYQDEGFISRNVAYLAEGTRWQGREDDILARARAQVPPEMGDAACELLSTAIRLSRAYQEEILRG